MQHSCQPSCTQDWLPTKKCHCSSCGENFSTPANFDRHRVKGGCKPPESVGLSKNLRGVYVVPGTTTPEDDESV